MAPSNFKWFPAPKRQKLRAHIFIEFADGRQALGWRPPRGSSPRSTSDPVWNEEVWRAVAFRGGRDRPANPLLPLTQTSHQILQLWKEVRSRG